MRIQLFLVVVAVCSINVTLRAGDAPKLAVDGAEISISSFSDVDKQLTAMGIPVPPIFKAESTDAKFPFVGGLDETRPLSITFLIRPDLPEQNRAYFSIPSKNPTAFIKTLENSGAKPAVEGQSIYPLGGMGIKFDTDRVWFGGTVEVLSRVSDARLVKQYADGKVLLSGWLDMTDLRQNRPEVLKGFVDQIVRKQTPIEAHASVAEQEGQKIGRELVCNYIQNVLDRIELTLLKSQGDAISAHLLIAPGLVWETAQPNYPQPVLPAECVGRVDTLAPIPDMLAIKKALSTIAKAANTKSEVNEDDFAAFLQAFVAAHWSGEANSIGWSFADGKVVFYVVRQASGEQDVEALLKKVVDAAAQLDKESKSAHNTFKLEDYTTAKGDKVLRETITGDKSPALFIDVLPKGKRVYMTISNGEGKQVEQIPIGQDVPGQQIKKGVNLQIDLSRLANAVPRNSPEFPVPPSILDSLAKIKSPIVLKCEPDAKSLNIDLSVPSALVKALAESAAPHEEP
jgi:hypothetical protein